MTLVEVKLVPPKLEIEGGVVSAVVVVVDVGVGDGEGAGAGDGAGAGAIADAGVVKVYHSLSLKFPLVSRDFTL